MRVHDPVKPATGRKVMSRPDSAGGMGSGRGPAPIHRQAGFPSGLVPQPLQSPLGILELVLTELSSYLTCKVGEQFVGPLRLVGRQAGDLRPMCFQGQDAAPRVELVGGFVRIHQASEKPICFLGGHAAFADELHRSDASLPAILRVTLGSSVSCGRTAFSRWLGLPGCRDRPGLPWASFAPGTFDDELDPGTQVPQHDVKDDARPGVASRTGQGKVIDAPGGRCVEQPQTRR